MLEHALLTLNLTASLRNLVSLNLSVDTCYTLEALHLEGHDVKDCEWGAEELQEALKQMNLGMGSNAADLLRDAAGDEPAVSSLFLY